jgi:isopenicillin N synthase-like dioxygenase
MIIFLTLIQSSRIIAASLNSFIPFIYRVTNLTGKERYTIPFLFGVDHDTTISVVENCIADNELVSQAPFKAGDVSQKTRFLRFFD